MFEAMILVCLVVDTSDCKVFEDTRGPYETIGQCNDRAAEMTIEVMNDSKLEQFVVSGARCDKISGLKT
tara:strand:+ start:517 stop:723 length:207 start_codon:yes stop_codon:yes gene_type:complete